MKNCLERVTLTSKCFISSILKFSTKHKYVNQWNAGGMGSSHRISCKYGYLRFNRFSSTSWWLQKSSASPALGKGKICIPWKICFLPSANWHTEKGMDFTLPSAQIEKPSMQCGVPTLWTQKHKVPYVHMVLCTFSLPLVYACGHHFVSYLFSSAKRIQGIFALLFLDKYIWFCTKKILYQGSSA